MSVTMAASSFENEFKDKLFKKYSQCKKYLIPKEEYNRTIDELKTVAEIATSKSRHHYYLLKKYEVLQCGDVDKLIKKRKSPEDRPIYFATIEDTYDIISKAHTATGHGGRDRMLKHLGLKYANITTEAVELFKSYCRVCQEKRKRPKTTGVVVKPILSSEFNSRGQVDLVDMQSSPQGQFKWIMVYQCHLTKFVILRPLSSKRAAEVAFQLLDIFLLFGAPAILQSDNGSEFTAKVITELKDLWPHLIMVHGKPRHPQSQGSVERANGDIKDILVAWMSDNNTQDWTVGLKFVQQQKNCAHHVGIKQTPYKAMFGEDPKVGLTSSSLPPEILERLQSEDDLLALHQSTPPDSTQPLSTHLSPTLNIESTATESSESTPPVSTQSLSTPLPPTLNIESTATESSESTLPVSTQSLSTPLSPTLNIESTSTESSEPASDEINMSASDNAASTSATGRDEYPQTPDPNGLPLQASSDLEKRLEDILNQRKRARESQLEQAERMVKRSRIDLKAGEVGDNVAVPIPMVDRGRGDPRNILGVVLDRDEHNMYQIAVKAGILNTKYSRNQFDLCPQRLLQHSDVNTEVTISLRQALKAAASGGQGFFRCDCSKGKKQCQTNRCKCYKAKQLCNSRCHSSLNCKNKH